MSDPMKFRIREATIIEGISPEVTLEQQPNGVQMTVKDKNGTKTALIPKGDSYVLTEADKEQIADAAFESFEAAAEADVRIAEGWAKGTQDDVPVESGSPYYHDNAKYYSEQAADSADDADTAKTEAQTAAASASAAYGTSLLAPNFSTESTYAVGDYVIYSGNLYRCTTAVTTAGAWNNSSWTQVAVGGEVGALKSAINGYEASITPTHVDDLNFPPDGTAYVFNSAYETYYLQVKTGYSYDVGITNGTGTNYYRFAFTQSIPAHNVSGTYIEQIQANTGVSFTKKLTAQGNGYLSVSYYEGSLSAITASEYIEGITEQLEEIKQKIDGVDFDEIEERLDDDENRIEEIEGQIIEFSVNRYDSSLQTSDTISPHYWVNGAPYSTTQFDNSYNCTALIPVKPNTTYTVGLVGATPTNPWNTAGQRGWSFDKDGNYISGSGWSSNTFTTPSNAAYIRFNYYKSAGTVDLAKLNAYCMLVEGNSLPSLYSPYYNRSALDIAKSKAGYPIRAIVNADSMAVFVISKYNTQYDQMVKVGTGGGNGLIDFRGFYTIPNGTDDLSENGDNAVAYLETSGDWHAPFIVSASQNADGDQPSNRYFTGGNHQYNNTGSGSTPTARVANIKFVLDNRELSADDNKCGRVLEIKWNNYVQAFNTTKEDGTGREVLKEEHRLVFDGRTWESYVSLIPLEDITIGTWYGFQLMGLNTVFQNIRYIGATNRGLYNYATASDCGDSKTNEMVCYGTTHQESMRIDPTYDLGDFTHIGTNKSLFSETYGKAYAYLVASTAMEEGTIWSAHATYRFVPA